MPVKPVLNPAQFQDLDSAYNALTRAMDVQRMVVSALSKARMTSTLAQYQKAMMQLQEVHNAMYQQLHTNGD